MNISRRTFLAATAATGIGALFGAVGCSSSTASPNAADAASGNATTVGSFATTEVIDCEGRRVSVPRNPERVSMLDSFAGELGIMVGMGSKIVGVPHGVSSDVILNDICPTLGSVSAPVTSGTVNMEEFMATKPQVAVVKRDLYNSDGQSELLDASGVPYVVVGYESMSEQIDMMRLVGQVCGGDAEKKADALADLYESVITECAERTSDLAESEKVRVFHSINALVMTDGATSLGADWINAAGCIDVSAQHPEIATTTDYVTTLEQIFKWDPDAFVCNSVDTTDYLLSRDNCAGLRAVQNRRCYTIPVGATRWGQRGSVETYLAMLWIGCTMYPDRYADFDLKRFVVDYYRDYLEIEVTDELYEMMLSGRGLRKTSVQAATQK